MKYYFLSVKLCKPPSKKHKHRHMERINQTIHRLTFFAPALRNLQQMAEYYQKNQYELDIIKRIYTRIFIL